MQTTDQPMILVPESFVQAVEDVLSLQKEYYKGRQQSQLILAKQKEQEVRSMLREIRKDQGEKPKPQPQMDLFQEAE